MLYNISNNRSMTIEMRILYTIIQLSAIRKHILLISYVKKTSTNKWTEIKRSVYTDIHLQYFWLHVRRKMKLFTDNMLLRTYHLLSSVNSYLLDRYFVHCTYLIIPGGTLYIKEHLHLS